MKGKGKPSFKPLDEDDDVENQDMEEQVKETERESKTEDKIFKKMKYVNYIVYLIAKLLDVCTYVLRASIKLITGIQFSFVELLKMYDQWLEMKYQYNQADKRIASSQNEKSLKKRAKTVIDSKKRQVATAKVSFAKTKSSKADNKKDGSNIIKSVVSQLNTTSRTGVRSFRSFGIIVYMKFNETAVDVVHTFDKDVKVSCLFIKIKDAGYPRELQVDESTQNDPKTYIVNDIRSTVDDELLGNCINVVIKNERIILCPSGLIPAIRDVVYLKPGSKIGRSKVLNFENLLPNEPDEILISWRNKEKMYVAKVDPIVAMTYTDRMSSKKVCLGCIVMTKTTIPIGAIVVDSLVSIPDRENAKKIFETGIGFVVDVDDQDDVKVYTIQFAGRADFIPEISLTK